MEGGLAIRASKVPALILGLWLGATLFWWAFAFMPLPAAPPAWLSAARYACFGAAIEGGLPAAEGWMLLVLTPLTFLAGILILWGTELPASLRAMARSRAGQALFAVALGALLLEGAWVSVKVRTAQAVTRFDPAAGALDPEPLPADYPRRTATAPDFSLVDQRGATVSLASLRGRPVVVTFVFAHCQALCPLLVSSIKRAAPAAEVLLVTLDPWRDTPGALPGLAEQWALPPNFHVLSSRRADEVVAVARAWDMPFERDEKTGDISHPGLVFLVDPQGRLAYTFNNPPAPWLRTALDRLG